MVHHSRVRRSLFPICLLALFPLSGCDSGSRPSHIGKTAPDFTLQDTERKVTLSQFRGQVIVLNFWATWCPPCVEELPSLINMQGRMKEKGVTVLAVSIDVDADAYRRFIKQHQVNFLTIRDPEQKSSALYGTFGWPETYIIDRNGVVRRKLVGPVDWNSPEVNEFLARL
jgi:cytochrome c biogenesis protein CcmG/thiol:disulfide interchange protein DsbE